jgi:hypothetical protein
MVYKTEREQRSIDVLDALTEQAQQLGMGY